MVRRGRAHLQKQGGMLASLSEDHVPHRKENLHSNKLEVARSHKPAQHRKEAPAHMIHVQPKLSQRQLSQRTTCPPNLKETGICNDEVKSPTITTPPVPLSSIKINLSDGTSSNETVRKELFHSPISTVSSPPITRNSRNSNEGSANESYCTSSPVSSSYESRTSADSRSVVSQEDEGYSETLSSQIDAESNESLNSEEGQSCLDENNSVASEDNSANSCGESMPQYDYEDDEEYSTELEESEDELEFDEDSEDGMVRMRKGRKKSTSCDRNSDKRSAAVAKKPKSSKNAVASSGEKSKKINFKSAKAEHYVEMNADEESRTSKDNDNNEADDSLDDRETSCDFEAEAAPHESPEQTAVNKECSNEMSSYIATLQHTQIKSSKSSIKRPSKVASLQEPSLLRILSVVDELFQMIDDIDTVTVKDIVHSVAEYFGISELKKETKKAIKSRLTELICAKVAGVEASKPKSSNKMPKDLNRKHAGAKQENHEDEAKSTKLVRSNEPMHSDIISLVDELFETTDSETVRFSHILGSVATHFGISKVKKETKRLVKDRFIELMSSGHKNAEPDIEQQCANQVSITDNSAFEDPGSGDKVVLITPSSEIIKEKETIIATENYDGPNVSLGEVDASFDIDISDSRSVKRIEEDNSSIETSTRGPVSSPTSNLKSRDQSSVKLNSNDKSLDSNDLDSDNKNCSCSQDIRPNTPETKKNGANLESWVENIDSEGRSLIGEFLKCNESFMSCETTLFKNLSPECLRSTMNESVDNLMGSLSITDSLDATNESKRVEKGKWNLGKEIGSGSFGVVHVGMNANDGSLMAVKVLRIPSENKSAMVQELQREIDLMRSLNHPNIVRYMGAEVDTKNNILNIFQEWVPGGSVSSLLKQLGPFSIAVVRSYTKQILNGLEYLHSHHIIHRDIKGGNILISLDGCVKLADFGASKQVKAFGTDPDKMMEELTVRGTPYFMAPEVFEEKYGPKADVWSVGGVVFQMATGVPPWKDLGHKNPISLFFHLKNTEHPPELPTTINNYRLKDFLSLCFQRNPMNRPNAKALLNSEFLSLCPEENQSNNTPLKIPCNESPSGPVANFLPNHVPSPDANGTGMCDSLCYSLTIPAPLNGNKHEIDITDWPDWARQSYLLSSERPKSNPFSRANTAEVNQG